MGPQKLHLLLEGFEDKSGYAQCIIAYKDSAENDPVLFVGRTPGTIVPMKGDTHFGWDPNFLPEGYDKTYAELDKDIKN